MPHVFVSHASPDKARIRPLIEALAREGVRLWLDRPGYGDSHFDFDRSFIDRYEIRALSAGEDWSEAIAQGLRESSAVLFCLSRAASADRKVMAGELTVAVVMKKIVVVVVDDLRFEDFPRDLGLVDLTRMHVERVDPAALARLLAAAPGAGRIAPSELPADQAQEFEIVLKIKHDLNEIAIRNGQWSPSAEDIRRAIAIIREFPIGPMVRYSDIPLEVIGLFADRLGHPERARLFLDVAMKIRSDCDPEGYGTPIVVRMSELPPLERVSAQEFWTVALTEAGLKSRRTLAALILAPGGPLDAPVAPELADIIEQFLAWLKDPEISGESPAEGLANA